MLPEVSNSSRTKTDPCTSSPYKRDFSHCSHFASSHQKLRWQKHMQRFLLAGGGCVTDDKIQNSDKTKMSSASVSDTSWLQARVSLWVGRLADWLRPRRQYLCLNLDMNILNDVKTKWCSDVSWQLERVDRTRPMFAERSLFTQLLKCVCVCVRCIIWL